MVLQVIEVLLFAATDPFGIAVDVLLMIGLIGMFKKSGIAWWHALIPVYNIYELSRCADRETEGTAVVAASLVNRAVNIAVIFLPDMSDLELLQVGIAAAAAIVALIYTIRIYIGLCELYGRGKKWLWLWIPFECIAALVWGFGKKFRPRWQVEDAEKDARAYFAGSRSTDMSDGLTVNLEKRTARELLHKQTLLRDIHMDIQPGHMVLLLGGSGAGKTTLISAINGYEKAKAQMVLNKSNIYREYKKMKYRIGFVPQQDLMRGNDTVIATLNDAAALRLPMNFTAAERHERVSEVMQMFGLTPVQGSMVNKLSGGQRKRLSIAMEMLSSPSLFILDEPDSGLDGVMARELMTQLRAIADQGKIVIVITHTPDRVVDLFDDVIVLAKDKHRTGRLAYFGPVEGARAFFEREQMEQIVRSINRAEEGGEGRADEFIERFAEVQHG